MKKIIALFLALIATLPLFAACSTPEDSSFVGSPDAVKIAKSDFLSLPFIRPIRVSPDVEEVLTEFGATLSETYGFFEMKDDRMTEESERELLFGETNRSASATLLSEHSLLHEDFVISHVDGKTLILASSAAGYTAATEFFLENCIDTNGDLWIPKLYVYHKSYPIESISVKSHNLFDYTVVASSSYADEAETFISLLCDLTGRRLEKNASDKYKHIYIGKAPTDDVKLGETFAELATDGKGNLYLYGASLEKAIDIFFFRTLGYDGIAATLSEKSLTLSEKSYVADDYTALLASRKSHYTTIELFLDSSYTGSTRNGEAATPYASFDEAFAAIKAKIEAEDMLNITLTVKNGTYLQQAPAALDMTDCQNSYFLTVTGESRDGVTVTSELPLPGSSFIPSNDGKTYAASLPQALKKDGSYPAFHDLSINGTPLTVARSSGERVMRFDLGYGYSSASLKNLPNEEKVLYVDTDLLSDFENNDAIRGTELWIRVEWQIHCLRIVGFDLSRSVENGKYTAVLIDPTDFDSMIGNYQNTLAGRSYWLENSESLIDEPGEFCVKNGKITLYPPKNVTVSNATVALPVSHQLLSFKGTNNLTVSNMTFTGTANTFLGESAYITGQCGYLKNGEIGFLPYAAIFEENATNTTVSGCAFYNLAYDGVSFRGFTKNASVDHCEFYDMAASAIRFGQNDTYSKENRNDGISILQNHVQKTGTTFASSPGIYVSGVDGLAINYNTLIDTSYSAISVGWSWAPMVIPGKINVHNAEIAYNYIESFMLNMKDGGAIYVVGGNAVKATDGKTPEYFNSCHHNYCVVGKETGTFVNDLSGTWTVLYHDGAASNWSTRDNVIYSAHDTKNVVNPTRFSYIAFQTGEGSQAYDCFSDYNFIVNISSTSLFYGLSYKDRETGALLFSKQHGLSGGENETVLPDNAALLASPEAMEIVNGAGCDGHKGRIPEDY